MVSLAVEFGVGDWDAGGSEFVDDGDIEVDGGVGGEEVGGWIEEAENDNAEAQRAPRFAEEELKARGNPLIGFGAT